MKLLCWNCRGIGNASMIRALKAQIKMAKPNLIFLSETKSLASRMGFVRNAIRFDNMLVVEANGQAGGLCILWKNVWLIKEVEFNKNHIAVTISDAICEWLMVGFYGPSYFSKKKKAWEGLTTLLEVH